MTFASFSRGFPRRLQLREIGEFRRIARVHASVPA